MYVDLSGPCTCKDQSQEQLNNAQPSRHREACAGKIRRGIACAPGEVACSVAVYFTTQSKNFVLNLIPTQKRRRDCVLIPEVRRRAGDWPKEPWFGRRILMWCLCPWDWRWWPATTCGSSTPSCATRPALSSASTPSPGSAGSPSSWPSNTEKNGVLAVQTLRNNIMASTVLATTAIMLVSVISVFIGATAGRSPASTPSSPSSSSTPLMVYGSKTGQVFAVKYLAISICFMLAFVCNVQAIRLYAHASFLLGLPPGPGGGGDDKEGAAEDFAAYVARTVNRGSHAWSLGLRAFYVSLALFMWTFGPIPMLACSVLMCALLYFLDTTGDYAKGIQHIHREMGAQKDSTV